MGLRSELFRGDAKLEAAAVADPSHIKLGARGDHVLKIQQALIELDGASLDADSAYGPATASAVLAYKKKRKIINRSYQSQADNIVGKMTIAALDEEMLAAERAPGDPIRIQPISPGASGLVSATTVARRSTLLLAFKFSADIDPNIPNAVGPFTRVRLEPRTTGSLLVRNGKGGVVTCNNELLVGGTNAMDHPQTCQIFDTSDPNPVIRLVPDPRGPIDNATLSLGGTVQLTNNIQGISIDGYRPGNAFVHASNAKGTSLHTIAIEVRAPKLVRLVGQQTQPLTKTRPDSKGLLSADGADGSVPGGLTGGRPVNPKNIPGKRKINLGGEGETPGFESYTPSLPHSAFRNNLASRTQFRPWTEDADPSVFIPNKSAGDICLRGIPLNLGPNNIDVIRRIAAPGCRITFDGDVASMLVLKQAFPVQPSVEFADGAIVIELP